MREKITGEFSPNDQVIFQSGFKTTGVFSGSYGVFAQGEGVTRLFNGRPGSKILKTGEVGYFTPPAREFSPW